MRRGDALVAVEICNRARDAQDAVHRAGGEVQGVDRALEQGLVTRCETAIARGGGLVEGGIGHPGAIELALPRVDHPLTDVAA